MSEISGRKWRRDEIECALLHGFKVQTHIVHARNHDDVNCFRRLARERQEICPRAVRQGNIGEQEVRWFGPLQESARFFARRRSQGLNGLVIQSAFQVLGVFALSTDE